MTATVALILLVAAPDSALPLGQDSLATHKVLNKSPGRAVLYSLLLPGGGQIYTRNYWKAAIIAPAEVALGYLSYSEHMKAREGWARQDTVAYLQHRDRRNTFLWWTGAVVVFSMADAYVSAQMFGFDEEMRLSLGLNRVGIQLAIR
ncbi:MAG: hypothetical protein K6T77_00575 [candidate division WOR-3 bacterium]|jgi:hypothetical protein|nr:hypothetical protein [candidate division WOR-3 bacterium]MCR4424336.1 DUF5683 domain-containing protein [candidate division WOR-3 bacterium]MDH7518154.1 DUF5683 domain-containing protein [bacterium]